MTLDFLAKRETKFMIMNKFKIKIFQRRVITSLRRIDAGKL